MTSRMKRPLLWRTRLTAAFAVLATLAFLSWTFLRLSGLRNPRGAGIPSSRSSSTPPGILIIDAAPWGEIRQILGPAGLPRTPPSDAVTPLVLELPAGRYRIDLAGPPGSAPQSCEVELASALTERCRLSFAALEAIDYFRESGWWH